ncbi:MAG: AGE family epimerase/isomerase [Saprospiraceae bacterium]|nr:AGE family epimerase/isomerase [Saprospiraceae bacterium]
MKYSQIYRRALFDDVIPFWITHSLDEEQGGYLHCLDRQGAIYDEDKFVWFQCRQIWMLSLLHTLVQGDSNYLNAASLGMDFVEKHARDGNGDFYFSLDRTGRPLIKPYNIFSDCFGAIAYYQYGAATSSEYHLTESRKILRQILLRRDNPKGIFEKSTGIRDSRSFALPMILSNLALQMKPILDTDEADILIRECQEAIFGEFYNQETGLVHEVIGKDGQKYDTFDGRLINPGHVLEAMWFLMDIGEKDGDIGLIDRCISTGLHHLNYAWDSDFGGIFYFMDHMNKPMEKLEWDQKLWWVHLEALVFLSKALRFSDKAELRSWFEKVHNYTWAHFPDPEYGEWYGYLNRAGDPLHTFKGGKWKGCFHLPGAYYIARRLWRKWECKY